MKSLNLSKLLVAASLCLLTASVSRASLVNLVANGSFENPVVGPYESGKFIGWTQIGNTSFSGVVSGKNFGGNAPTDGKNQALFGAVGTAGGISQEISGLIKGESYDFTFDLALAAGGKNSVTVKFGDTLLLDLSNIESFSYQPETFHIVADNPTATISFLFRDDPSYFLLDNVRLEHVSPVPEPSTFIAGGLLLLPFGLSVFRTLRRGSKK